MYPSLIITKQNSGSGADASAFTQYRICLENQQHTQHQLSSEMLTNHPQIVSLIDTNLHYFSKDIA